jgi:hypothetical protein
VYSDRPQTSHQDERKEVYLDSNTSTIGSLEQNLKFLRVQAAESLWLLTVHTITSEGHHTLKSLPTFL